MIKKDVVYGDETAISDDIHNQLNQNQEQEAETVDSIDDIFANADRIMCEQNQSLNFTPKRPKKRKHSVLKTVLGGILILVLLLVGSVFAVIQFAKQEYPRLKETFLIHVEEFQEQLHDIDDSQLNVDEYYLKRALLLFTVEEIDLMIQNVEEIDEFPAIILRLDKDSLELIPPEKREAYQRLMEEYHEALEAQADGDDSDVEPVS